MSNKLPGTTHDRYVWLDFIRGLAAVAVCAGHLRAVMWVDYSQHAAPTTPQKLVYAMTGLGHQAVMVFFVLSGFFVGGAVLKAKEQFYWPSYATARLARLWTVLVPCLLLTWAVDQYLAMAAPEVLAGAFNESWHSGPKPNEHDVSLLTLLGNLVFLQTIAVPVFGTNGPLWSLANEFWYYLVFPLLAVAAGMAVQQASLSQRALSGLCATAVLALMPGDIQLGFVVWMMGAVVFAMHRTASLRATQWLRRMLLPALLFFGLSLAYSKSMQLQARFWVNADLVVGVTFSMVCLTTAGLQPPRLLGDLFSRVAMTLSEISYSLYLSHFPLVVLLGWTFYRSGRLAPSGDAAFQLLTWLVALLLAGFTCWWLFERHTSVIRASVLRRFAPTRSAARGAS